ncbi:hypothetical protein VOLCADRAFT_118325 [Volvox carteri f. nagariensis]|uniref:Uncharacterized protein n=1 Tax=Volvox carteri f. nagariensis TaxID=3068 RepID=D8U4A2_VOLCA|nr:uncharacterized protein VOLCADRAFT_118325 [Volvox carteri f. nagariensis]EFJ45368.1 hypothetical protein VOLCADRAFT_118325 [Volvox carteri f. nagariensis]|eukprot:XP_002953395.1 hypothetical protein VOLCADRAFT_118325 [Volvox carteri f. nagariensis]
MRRAALASLALCTHLRLPATLGKADLVTQLPRLRGMTDLDLSSFFRVVNNEVLAAIAEASALTRLSLQWCDKITTAGLADLGRLRNLRVLSLHSVHGIDDLSALAALPALQDLDLSWCHRVRSQSLPNMHRLRRLMLHGCELVDDSLCTALCTGPGVAELEELDMAFTQLGDHGLLLLATHCPELRRLVVAEQGANIWRTGMWTEEGMQAFERQRPDVRVQRVC